MKKQSHKSRKIRTARRKAEFQAMRRRPDAAGLGVQARAGDAITPAQIYEGGTNAYSNWIELGSGALLTQGYAPGAEQRERLNPGAFGGIEDLHYQADVAKKTTFTLDGHSIFDDRDYKLGLGLNREDLGFVQFQLRKFPHLVFRRGRIFAGQWDGLFVDGQRAGAGSRLVFIRGGADQEERSANHFQIHPPLPRRPEEFDALGADAISGFQREHS